RCRGDIVPVRRRDCGRTLPCAESRAASSGGSAAAGINLMFSDLGSQAYTALRYNRRRSLLTMLGMAWGIATVVPLLAYGSGFQNALMLAFRTFGGNLVAIFPGRTSQQVGGSKAGTEIKLTRDDIEYLRTEVPLIKRISPEVNKQSLIAYGTRSNTYNV